MSLKTERGLGEAERAGTKNLDSSEQDESSFREVGVAEREELAEHNLGEPEGNTNYTEQGVRLLQ